MDIAALSKEIAEGKAVVIDVRTKEEWDEGHAAPAIHFPLDRIMAGEIPPMPDGGAVYLYCRSGGRSDVAKMVLEHAGNARIVNLGGLHDWEAMGGATER
jgi:phage shock protein E